MPKKKPAIDPAHIETEAILSRLERRIAEEYATASKEIQETIDSYFKRFRAKDEIWRRWVKEGKKTEKEYRNWRYGQMAVGDRWKELKEQIADDMQNTSNIAKSIAFGFMPAVYALNFNYATYQIETGGLVDTSFTLYSRESVERILRDNPELLPAPGKKVSQDIADGLAKRWNRQHVQSVMMQGILQGDSIPDLAKRLRRKVGDSNRAASIRNARTMATGAQNAGRVDAAIRAESLGVKSVQEWSAILDMRTRTDHRLLHGQRREIGEPFVVPEGGHYAGEEIRYPGDIEAAPGLVYNCRCTLLTWPKGFEGETLKSSPHMEGMSFEEWQKAKPKSNRIDLPEKRAAKSWAEYVSEYTEKENGARNNN